MSCYACIRCGMCCIVSPCAYSGVEDDDCPYLTIDEDLTTTCNNAGAKIAFVDTGCMFQRPHAKEIYEIHMQEYQVVKRKEDIRRCYLVKNY